MSKTAFEIIAEQVGSRRVAQDVMDALARAGFAVAPGLGFPVMPDHGREKVAQTLTVDQTAMLDDLWNKIERLKVVPRQLTYVKNGPGITGASV